MPPTRSPLRPGIRHRYAPAIKSFSIPGPLPEVGSHGDNMLSYITKQEASPSSRQLQDPFNAAGIIGKVVNPPLQPERLLVLAEENAIHAACLQAKAKDAVGRGWLLESKGGQPHEKQTSDLADKLEKLCPKLTFSELLYQATWEQSMVGWSAWEVARTNDGEVGAIYPIPSHTIRATKIENVWVQIRGIAMRYFVEYDSQLAINPDDGEAHGSLSWEDRANELLIFTTYSPRTPYYGIPDWVSAIPSIAELTAIREYNVSFFASNGMTDRIIHASAQSLDHSQTMATTIHKGLKESRGRGHTSIVTYGTPESKVGVSFLSQQNRREGQFLQRREDLVKEVLMAHQVPPYRIGWAAMGSLGGSAAHEMLRTYRIGAIEPLQTVIEDRLNKTLFGKNGISLGRSRWRLSDLSWDETELNLEIATKSVQYGVYSPNESREMLGRERVEEPAMDEYFMNTALSPITGELADKAREDALDPPEPPPVVVHTGVPSQDGAVPSPSGGAGSPPTTDGSPPSGGPVPPKGRQPAKPKNSTKRERRPKSNGSKLPGGVAGPAVAGGR